MIKRNPPNFGMQDLTRKQEELIQELTAHFFKEGKMISVRVRPKEEDGFAPVSKGIAENPDCHISWDHAMACYNWKPLLVKDGERFRACVRFSGVDNIECARAIRDTILSDEDLRMIVYHGIKGSKETARKRQKLIRLIKLMFETDSLNMELLKQLV